MSALVPLLTLLFGCGGCSEEPPVEAQPSEAAPHEPIPVVARTIKIDDDAADRARINRALAVRSPEPTCGEIDGLARNPAAALATLAVTATDPPYVSVRAATCLLTGHAREAEPHATAWLADPAQGPLALVVTGRLDGMPSDVARRLAEAGLAGPHAELVKGRLAKARSPELKALAQGGP